MERSILGALLLHTTILIGRNGTRASRYMRVLLFLTAAGVLQGQCQPRQTAHGRREDRRARGRDDEPLLALRPRPRARRAGQRGAAKSTSSRQGRRAQAAGGEVFISVVRSVPNSLARECDIDYDADSSPPCAGRVDDGVFTRCRVRGSWLVGLRRRSRCLR